MGGGMMLYYDAKRDMLPATPNDYYREHFQQLINSRWTNTTMLQDIEEETPFASFKFEKIQVHMIHALDKSTKTKQGNDFREIVFQDIDHVVNLGGYYKFNNAYWLTINLDELNCISKNIIVRRCNNVLKWKDENGTLYEYPCILEYDATAASPRVDNNVITPNNRVRVIVQANKDTLPLKVNKRFIFGDRPFKIIGLNNYMIDHIGGVQHIMYITVQLDEISPYDDFVNNIAYNTNTDTEIEPPVEPKNGIIIEPMFEFVRQHYTTNFEANLYIDDVKQDDVITVSASGAPDWTYNLQSLGNNQFSLMCKQMAQIPLELTFTNGDISESIFVDLKSMF
jgi:hypothetical protein